MLRIHHHISRACALALTCGLVLVAPTTASGAGTQPPDGSGFGTTQVVAVRYGHMPDGNGEFVSFTRPTLNDLGQVAFSANLRGTDLNNLDNGVILRGTAGAITTILREGQATPDGDGTFQFLNSFPPGPFSPQPAGPESDSTTFLNKLPEASINNLGRAAFASRVIDAATNETQGVYTGDGGALDELLRDGQAAPGGGAFGLLAGPGVINDLNQTALLLDRDGRRGWYLASADALRPIVEDNQPTPHCGDTIAIDTTAVLLNHAGQAAVHDTQVGLFFATHGGLITLAQLDDLAPPEAGGLFTFFGPGFGFNNLSHAAFDAEFFGDGAVGRGLFTNVLGQNELVVLAFQDQAGASDLQGFNDAGQVLFTASKQQPTLFRVDGDAFVNLSEQFSTPPVGEGAIKDFQVEDFNHRGQVLVDVLYSGTPGGEADDRALLFCDDALGCQPVIRKGDALLGSTVVAFELAEPNALNNLSNTMNAIGQVALRVLLADNRQAVVLWTPTVLGDADMDYAVGLSDLDIVGRNFGQPLTGWRNADFTGDGVVSLADLNAVGVNFGRSALPAGDAAAVPEPAACALLALGVLGVLRRRRA